MGVRTGRTRAVRGVHYFIEVQNLTLNLYRMDPLELVRQKNITVKNQEDQEIKIRYKFLRFDKERLIVAVVVSSSKAVLFEVPSLRLLKVQVLAAKLKNYIIHSDQPYVAISYSRVRRLGLHCYQMKNSIRLFSIFENKLLKFIKLWTLAGELMFLH